MKKGLGFSCFLTKCIFVALLHLLAVHLFLCLAKYNSQEQMEKVQHGQIYTMARQKQIDGDVVAGSNLPFQNDKLT